MLRPGTEVIDRSSEDPQFGPVVVFSLGGIFVEVLNEKAPGAKISLFPGLG